MTTPSPAAPSPAAPSPAAPSPAATVLLLREDEGPSGFSVFMVRRTLTASFMPGAYVFPGGKVDPEDAAGVVSLDDAALHARFSGALSPEVARAHLVAGAREVEEEALVRLPDPAALRTWSRWVTPEAERRRFDTWFLVGRMPPGAAPSHDDREVEASTWVDPRLALARYGQGAMLLAPPTWYTLWELSLHDGLEAVLSEAARRVVRPVMPRFETVGEAMSILLPGDPLYPSTRPVDPRGPSRFQLGAGGRWWGVKG